MNIAVVDDNLNDRKMILDYLSQFFNESGGDYTTSTFEDGVSFLKDYSFSYDFIIFDIDMPQMSGIDTAKELRKKDSNVTIMFVTNMPQYALEGYSVEAVDYVLKPLSYPDFRLKMKKATRYILRNSVKKITINTTEEGLITVDSSDIYYVESKLHYIYYHTKKGIYKMRAKLTEVEDILLPYHFARSGGSFLINLAYLEKIDGNEIVVADETLPLSRRMKASLMSAFTKYIGGI
ncbi:two component transcriptional regulator, LytTR family [Pseudobutyrivibrio sp. OR37]|uniref:LytR/AlgR family response regulator transcription factor n=1 Tax=Pseudobutyrivibrio sp. OR37 TaxID=1798186 RepID=UPI0008ED986A|nr:LytTR family DNA-binding domain-containing protein [Pseudobutyrivibrio sp. OR37]SFI38578.1 two component transcriptional regulator, LytTR family [Pseudobutyrivibrio sp. OR37]